MQRVEVSCIGDSVTYCTRGFVQRNQAHISVEAASGSSKRPKPSNATCTASKPQSGEAEHVAGILTVSEEELAYTRQLQMIERSAVSYVIDMSYGMDI